ncbi:hypothetical protein OsJ_06228 [Oryza sativa Japonica Group]|uniref:Uncharacterized protein n=1 Tax=Oryza sativa subsp. japonica TaxID=39947 RepID=B9F4Z4_ORYSJ|nr:hypothetical protein OsJ_06228 [Oryza sativa Japonica Group]
MARAERRRAGRARSRGDPTRGGENGGPGRSMAAASAASMAAGAGRQERGDDGATRPMAKTSTYNYGWCHGGIEERRVRVIPVVFKLLALIPGGCSNDDGGLVAAAHGRRSRQRQPQPECNGSQVTSFSMAASNKKRSVPEER